MTEVLVLGATGFLGGHIARAALRKGWTVHGFRRDPQATGHLQHHPIRWREGDLADPASLLSAMAGMDVVFHAAGFYPPDNDPGRTPEYVDRACQEMNHVLQAAGQSGISRLIYPSSLTTIGLPPADEDRPADERDVYQPGTLPVNGYYESKIAMEALALQAHEQGLEVVILNPTLIFGPGDVHLSTGEILLAVAEGKAAAVPPGWINIIDARDAAEAHVAAVRLGRSGERYILGGENLSIPEAVEVIARLAGVRPPLFTLPRWAIDSYLWLSDRVPFLPFAPFHFQAYRRWQRYNTEKAVRELNLITRSWEETILDSLNWFDRQGING